ncbi:MAG: hypothetical protein ACKO2P_12550 [Planctomycetota bacterium]
MRVTRILLISLFTFSASGCRYDGAFMQMDSNAPFPFFGFQLAVDSGVRPPGAGGTGRQDSSGRGRRPEDILPLREYLADELDVPLPRLQPAVESAERRRTPTLLVRMPKQRFVLTSEGG